MKQFLTTMMALAMTLFASVAFADHVKLGKLTIMQPEIRETPKEAPVSAGYLKIRNDGDEADTLLSASSGFSGMVQLHKMEVVDGVARMRPQKDGIPIPAGGEVVLENGGLHIMFMKLEEQMKAGDHHTVTLTFEKAGKVDVEMHVVALDGKDHSGHGDHDHDHDGEKKEHSDHSH